MVQELSTAAAIVSVIKAMGGWGVGGALFVLIGVPTLAALYMARMMIRAIDKQSSVISALQAQVAASEKESARRFILFTTRYDNNIELVKNYEKMAASLTDLVHVNVQAMTRMVEKITSNQYCPIVRRKGNPDE